MVGREKEYSLDNFKVAVDASWAGQGSGIGRMYREVLGRAPIDVPYIEVLHSMRCGQARSPWLMSRFLGAHQFRSFWSPGFMPPSRNMRFPVAITIHDLTHLEYYSRVHKLYYNLVLKPFLKNVSLIFTVSEFSRRKIIEWAGLSACKVKMIYNGVSEVFNPEGPVFENDKPYVLYVGNRRGYKNIERLLSAFSQTKIVGEGYQLVLSGSMDDSLFKMCKSYKVEQYVKCIGFVDEERLSAVYRGAEALAFPSLMEGFGLPVVEAMASGVPVVTSNSSALAEVGAAGASCLVDPYDVEAIADALDRTIYDSGLRQSLIKAGLERAKVFSWDSAGREYWRWLRELVCSTR